MNQIIIDAENISKLYSIKSVGAGTFANDLNRWVSKSLLRREDPFENLGVENIRDIKTDSKYIWALKDVSFRINKGEIVGVMGRNGSGKSTLLKILSKITTPTRGHVTIKGRISSILESGTGFQSNFTGRENIFMNGSILGMTTSEIKRKFDEMVEFAGIERFIDTPVKRYSSGMKARLGFTIATSLESDIILIDEVLAVGDREFKRKALNRMRSISQDEGKTVIIVSHNTLYVRQLCQRGIILDNGRLLYDGDISGAIDRYLHLCSVNELKEEKNKMDFITEFKDTDGDEKVITISNVSLTSPSTENGVFLNSEQMNLQFDVDIITQIEETIIGFNIYNQRDTPIARADYNDVSQVKTLAPGKYRFHFTIPPCTLALGRYMIKFDMHPRGSYGVTTEKSELRFEVRAGDDNFGNVFYLDSTLKLSLIHENWLSNIYCLSKH